MSPYPPARAGDTLADIDTPALILDMDAFERNLDAMAAFAAAAGIALRPHAKSHKCAEVALRQVARGAVGICCQKLAEAEALADRGIQDILLTNEVIGAAKLARLAALARRVAISVLADSPEGVAMLARAAADAGVKLGVLVEVDVGAKRCGVQPGGAAVTLARAIAASPSLAFRGLHAYHGAAQHLRLPHERAEAIHGASVQVATTVALLAMEGLVCEVVTGAGTGTFAIESASRIWNEIQPGSYVFMDADYNHNVPDDAGPRFEQSLYVLATVMSAPVPSRRVVDAGLKASSVDSGMPQLVDWRGVKYVKASDEHGVLAVDEGAAAPALGERVRLIPGHCDPTVNLYDHIVCVRGDRVEAVWNVDARGALG